ncbi:MAG: YciI family protein [Rubrivivax sp.]|nr:YciI family protein [Rubrivivax sp.]
MPHMLLIIEPVGQREERGVEGGQALYQRMLDFTEELRRDGVLMASSSLATPATRLQRPAGAAAPRVLDGPFAEAREMVGGFFLLNCATRQAALDWAGRCPAAAWATVEVRETGPCFT